MGLFDSLTNLSSSLGDVTDPGQVMSDLSQTLQDNPITDAVQGGVESVGDVVGQVAPEIPAVDDILNINQ